MTILRNLNVTHYISITARTERKKKNKETRHHCYTNTLHSQSENKLHSKH